MSGTSDSNIDDALLARRLIRACDRAALGTVDAGGQPYTSLVLTAYARSPRRYREEDGPFIRNAVKYLKALVKENGAIYFIDQESLWSDSNLQEDSHG